MEELHTLSCQHIVDAITGEEGGVCQGCVRGRDWMLVWQVLSVVVHTRQHAQRHTVMVVCCRVDILQRSCQQPPLCRQKKHQQQQRFPAATAAVTMQHEPKPTNTPGADVSIQLRQMREITEVRRLQVCVCFVTPGVWCRTVLSMTS